MRKTVLYNGKIATPAGFVEGMVADGQRIAFLGGSEEALAALDVHERVDLGGRLVLPGFIDGHMHFLSYALSLERADFNGCRSIEELRSRLKRFIDESRPMPGEWIAGRGWNHEILSDGRMPMKEDLDDISPRNPTVLLRVCDHIAVLNSCALSALGLHGDSRFQGGMADVDEQGGLTGIVRESVVGHVIRSLPVPGTTELRRMSLRAAGDLVRKGLTSVLSDDLGSLGGNLTVLMDLFLSLDEEGIMPVRITEKLLLPDRLALDGFLSTGWRTGDGVPFFHIGPLKILSDGSLGARTALLREEYSDAPGVNGVAVHDRDELDDLVWTAHHAGMQVAAHAIGDGALDMCLDAIERALSSSPRDSRHYIIHCQTGSPDQYGRMARLGVGAAIQPPFVPSDREMALKRLGEERALSGYAWSTLKELGIFLSGGSDAPVESFDPLWGIYTAVTRADGEGSPPGGWNPSQRFSVAEAIDLYTRGGAYASFDEHRKGSLRVGMLADSVVLDRDILSGPEEEIKDAKVVLTMTGGRIVHRAL
ncbi:MAG: amidohydrolase [Synergistaceae bacterium]|nr:amidohydrolase [Synergistota bacterium]NLM72197.1 amidohydrolase [Synergistaceae bacterium]